MEEKWEDFKETVVDIFTGEDGGASAGSYDLMGIDETQIATVKSSIESYILNVENIINKINTTNTSVVTAFKGTAQATTVKNYLLESTNVIKGVTEQMRKFVNALETVKANYSTQSESITVNAINKDALDVNTGVQGFDD